MFSGSDQEQERKPTLVSTKMKADLMKPALRMCRASGRLGNLSTVYLQAWRQVGLKTGRRCWHK